MVRFPWATALMEDERMVVAALFDPFVSLLALVATLLGSILLGLIANRLLGIRQSWGRIFVVGFLGFGTGVTFSLTVGAQNINSFAHPFVFSASILVSIMLYSVAFELLARTSVANGARRRRAGVSNPLRSARRRLARWARYLQITGIAARHGLSPYVRGRRALASAGQPADASSARRLWRSACGAMEEAGGTFVKLGQVLSTRPDLLPPEAITEFSGLQDRVTPAPAGAVEALLAEELGASPVDVFDEFAPQPLAAASIAQVYRARLKTGEQVVVKVQRPAIREPVERDLDILMNMARTLEARAAWARDFGVVELAEGFAEALREELDFRVEARNTATVATSLDAQHSGGKQALVRVPRVFSQFSTSRVLVIEWLDGVNVREAGPLLDELGLDRVALARALLRCFLRQILRDGTFHADPHPGNVMVLRDGSLALIDFGSVGRLDPIQQSALQRMLIALERRDALMLADALLDIAQARPQADEERLERALAHFMAQRLGPGMPMGAEVFKELFAVLFEFGLAFPPVVGGVFRALVTLQGTLLCLAPEFQMVDEARAMGAEWMREMLAPRSLRKAGADELLSLLPILRRLPRRLDQLTAMATHGGLPLNVRLFADERDARFVNRLVSRVTLAFLGAALGIMSILLLGLQGGPAITLSPPISVYQMFGYLGLFISMILILRVIIASTGERAG
jgi:ubiquinone biosynthesis protein